MPSPLLLLIAAQASGADLTVGPGGAYATFADAIAVASPGDRVVYEAGTFTEDIDVPFDLEIVGEGIGSTILTGGSGNFLLWVQAAATVTLSDVTLDGGGVVGGLLVDGTVTADAIEIVGCARVQDGGCVHVAGGVLTLTDGLLVDPVDVDTANGGQIAVTGGGSATVVGGQLAAGSATNGGCLFVGDGSVGVVEGTEVSGCSADRGAGLYSRAGATLTVRGAVVHDNVAVVEGGGIRGFQTTLVVEDALFEANEGAGLGGGLSLDATDATLIRTTLSGNTAVDGAGLYQDNGGSLLLEDSFVEANTAAGDGGGLFSAADSTVVSRTLLCGNAAGVSQNDEGGALRLEGGGQVSTITNNRFVDNTAGDGAAVHVRQGSADVVNNTVVGPGSSPLISSAPSASVSLVNTLVAFNDVEAVDLPGSATLEYDGFWSNAGGTGVGVLSATNLVGVDPLLRDWAPGGPCGDDDLHLGFGSPLLDAGDPVLLDPDGTVSDIGAYGGPGSADFVDGDGDGVLQITDCDDTDASRYPGAVELVADGIDQDCDGVDLCYVDADSDGWGGTLTVVGTTLDCDTDPLGVGRTGDCDDSDPAVSPGEPELCGGVDEDCDGLLGDADPDIDPGSQGEWYVDADADGFGAGVPVLACDLPPGHTVDGTDCDDTDDQVNPGMPEFCDGVDQDCDLAIDEEVQDLTWYEDADGDGYGDPLVTVIDCAPVPGHVLEAGDCDPTDPAVSPDGVEGVADRVDQDCDGEELCFVDADGDGAGSEIVTPSSSLRCDEAGLSETSGDCDDGDPSRAPGLTDIPNNGIDEDCDGRDASADTPPDTGTDQPPGQEPGIDEGQDDIPARWFCSTTGGPVGTLGLTWWFILVWACGRRRAE